MNAPIPIAEYMRFLLFLDFNYELYKHTYVNNSKAPYICEVDTHASFFLRNLSHNTHEYAHVNIFWLTNSNSMQTHRHQHRRVLEVYIFPFGW